jgi:TDG/mug DNA glycosylase family protein
MAIGGRLELTLFTGHGIDVTDPVHDDLGGGRRFTWWTPDALTDVLVGAGFVVDRVEVIEPTDAGASPDHSQLDIRATRDRRLPDHVGAGMRLLCCGLNPSLHAADAGVGYVTPGNRFWPALLAAGLATADRDPIHLLHHDHIGMTDLVKRATARADELAPAEHRDGLGRLERLCAWLRPGALVVVGLAGWRVAVDRKATVGWQPEPLGGVPVYLLPSTSGLNAHTTPAMFVDHLQAAAAGPP